MMMMQDDELDAGSSKKDVDGCMIINPGPFSTNEFKFFFYQPADGTCIER